MNRLLGVLHPTFDALSAHADRGEVDGARTRVGRHVAGCEACRASVAEIRALGDAARAMRMDAVPSGLWARIESAAHDSRALKASAGITLAPEVDVPLGAPSLEPGRTAREVRRSLGVKAGLGVTAVAAVIVVGLAWPRPSGLQAAGTTRLTFAPARPIPGSAVTVRYQPAPWMKDASQLILVGRFMRPAGKNVSRFGASVFDELGDSLGMMTRAADGAFVATITLPPDFLAAGLGVIDPSRDEHDVDGHSPWIMIGGTPSRAPSFVALLAAQEMDRGWFNGNARYRPRQPVDVADSLKRYFPAHPAGWAYSQSYGVAKGKFDVLRFFQSAERKYASMYEALWPAAGLDAERLHDMVVFAHNIQEPDEALRWSARFVDEHPEDPRAMNDLAQALHAIELREPPALRDSIRHWMPALDRAYRAAPVPNRAFGEALRLAESYGDSSTKALWLSRSSANGAEGNIWMMLSWTTQPGRGGPVRELRVRVARACTLPPGRLPFRETTASWSNRCEQYRGMAYGALSSLTLAGGDTPRALAEADSAVVAMHRGQFCAPSRGYFDRALALLALGDTTEAESAFVRGSAAYPPGMARITDTVRDHLGLRYDSARYLARVDTVYRAAMACHADQRARATAREGRLGL